MNEINCSIINDSLKSKVMHRSLDITHVTKSREGIVLAFTQLLFLNIIEV